MYSGTTSVQKVVIVPVDGGGRTRPLTVGVERARGKYVAILDDDDVVFGHWIETFKSLANKHPGKVLRSPVAEQYVEPTEWSGGRPGYEVVGRPHCRWPEPLDVLDHLWENHSPPCGWAVPRPMFSDHGLRFDESLPVMEDWDVLMQAVQWCGVADSGEITALWRRWEKGDSSTSIHTENEWSQTRVAITANSTPSHCCCRQDRCPPFKLTACGSRSTRTKSLVCRRRSPSGRSMRSISKRRLNPRKAKSS